MKKERPTMFTLERVAVFAALFAVLPALAQTPRLGQPISPEDIAQWDISIGPDGAGLPSGSGTARQGEPVYVAKCQACHGEKGAGKPNDPLVGGIGMLAAGKMPVKTVGSYWPYATTLFDYVRRAMPFQATKSLSADELYAVSAYLLSLNGIIGPEEVMDAQSLPRVRMPNRDGFIPFPRNPRESSAFPE
jgi:cytochrome c